jgi:DNA polymerase III alpha subunit (gram-positive type)
MADVELPNPDDIEELRQKSFTRLVALTVAVYAVVLAVSSLGGNNAAKEMMMAQLEASNQWSFYQAKAMREALHRLEKLRLKEVDLTVRGATLSSEERQKLETLLAEIAREEERYTREKKEIEEEARRQQSIQQENLKKDPYFDYAEVLLQIAIVLASVAMLASSRPVFGLSLILAVIGTLLAINAFLGVRVDIPLVGG